MAANRVKPGEAEFGGPVPDIGSVSALDSNGPGALLVEVQQMERFLAVVRRVDAL
jgi:hypothetical protein